MFFWRNVLRRKKGGGAKLKKHKYYIPNMDLNLFVNFRIFAEPGLR